MTSHQQAGKFGLPKAVELACPARPAKAHHELLAQPTLHAALERRVRFHPVDGDDCVHTERRLQHVRHKSAGRFPLMARVTPQVMTGAEAPP